MTENVMIIIFGALISVLGVINMTGNISSLHSYHRKRVSEADRKPFGRLVGLGTLLIGASILTNGVLTLVYEKTQLAIYTFIGTAIVIAGIIAGLIITFIAMIKYNKGIF